MVLYFYGHTKTKPGAFCSNFYPSKFRVNANIVDKTGEIEVYTAEQAIMWLKALLMDDVKTAAVIAQASNPADCKTYGRQVTPFIEDRWNQYRNKVAFEVLMLKFQNPELQRLLLETGDEVLAEAAPRDKIWGIGLSVADASKGLKWRGENILGNTLMRVRICIRNN